MPLQPINLLDELNLGARPPRAPTTSASLNPTINAVPLFEPRDKRPIEGPSETQQRSQRQRTRDTSQTTNSPPLIQQWAPLLARPDGTPLSMIDKISSPDVAYGVSRAALLPLDMDRERSNSFDTLMKSILQSSAKVRTSSLIPLWSLTF
jgi:hypothetical protein